MGKSVYDSPKVVNKTERHILTILVDNEPGVLARVVGMFSGRGYNIESLNVAEVSMNEHLSRITVATEGNKEIIDQIRNQLMRIVPVHNVNDLTEEGASVEAEVALIYLEINASNKKEVYNVCDFYRARKIENEHNTSIFEIAGTSERIDAFIQEINKLVKVEVVRSGPVAISSLRRNMEEKWEYIMTEMQT